MATKKKEANIADQITEFTIIRDTCPFKISSDMYNTIMLPNFATNYIMSMMDIDYPDKAKQNPNGSLFMKPTKEILEDVDADIAQKYFCGKLNWDGIYNYKHETHKVNDALLYMYQNNSVINELLGLNEVGNILTGDIDHEILGKDINQHTADRKKLEKAPSFEGSPIDAITNYVESSIVVVESLARAVSGENVSELKNMVKELTLLNSIQAGEIDKYLKKNNEVLKLIADNAFEDLKNQLQKQRDVQMLISKVVELIHLNHEVYVAFANSKQGKAFLKWLLTDCRLNENDWEDHVAFYFSNIYVGKNNEDDTTLNSSKKINDLNLNQVKYINLYGYRGKVEHNSNIENESVSPLYFYNYNILNEDDILDAAQKKLELFNFDDTYNRVKSTVTAVMQKVCISDSNQWQIVKNELERMNKLKDAADKEILAKIDLICRTVNNGSSTLGEKFKAAISKHPMRAEGLKRIWAAYSDDLNDRIESRIRSIGGLNGNSSIFMTIKHFLTNTYPALIAMLITWKQVFMLCKKYYGLYPPVIINVDKQKAAEKSSRDLLMLVQSFADIEGSEKQTNQKETQQK